MVRVGMVRLGLIVALLPAAGCSALRDAFSAHAQVAGTAAGQILTVDRLAQVVGHAQRIPIRPDVLTGVANVYLDYAVFAAELGRGRDLHDSALVLASQWPVAAQLKWERYHAQVVATRGKLTPVQADSAFQAGTVRLFQHILIRIPQSAVPMVEQQKEKQATAILMQAAAKRGFNFAELARRYSEDPGSKTKGGVSTSDGAWAVRPGVRQCRVDAPAGLNDRRGSDAVRLPHHSPAAARRGAGLLPRRSRELALRPARLLVPGQPREPATIQDRVRRARAGTPGGAADRVRPERHPDAGHVQRRHVPSEGPGAVAPGARSERRAWDRDGE